MPPRSAPRPSRRPRMGTFHPKVHTPDRDSPTPLALYLFSGSPRGPGQSGAGPQLEPLWNTLELPQELQAGAGELNDPVSPPWRGLAFQITRRPGQRGKHHAPTGSFLGRLDQEFLERNVNVDIVEFEVEGGLHVARAYDARRGAVLATHPPQFLAFGEGHLRAAVAAGNGAFDRDFRRHFPNITTTAQGADMGAGWSASSTSVRKVIRLSRMIAVPGMPTQGQAHPAGMAGNSPVYSHGCKSPLPVAEGAAGKPSAQPLAETHTSGIQPGVYTSEATSWPPPTCPSTSGPRSSARSVSPARCWTGSPITSTSWR